MQNKNRIDVFILTMWLYWYTMIIKCNPKKPWNKRKDTQSVYTSNISTDSFLGIDWVKMMKSFVGIMLSFVVKLVVSTNKAKIANVFTLVSDIFYPVLIIDNYQKLFSLFLNYKLLITMWAKLSDWTESVSRKTWTSLKSVKIF